MTRVQLVVTGDLEKLAMSASLERALRGAGADVHFLAPFKVDGGTTTRLPPPSEGQMTPRAIERLANALVTQALLAPSKSQPVPDLVIGIDDLELGNHDQPEVVVKWLRRAVQENIAARYPSMDAAERAREALRCRCSFHLLVPLAESYFFGESDALRRAGVAPGTPVHLVGTDVEAFETDHPEFMPIAAARNAVKAAQGMAWWREERHPKRYLEFLLERSDNTALYDETVQGVAALRTLEWSTVGAAREGVLFVRALFEDISDLLGINNPLGPGTLSEHTYPRRTVRRDLLTLRNL